MYRLCLCLFENRFISVINIGFVLGVLRSFLIGRYLRLVFIGNRFLKLFILRFGSAR